MNIVPVIFSVLMNFNEILTSRPDTQQGLYPMCDILINTVLLYTDNCLLFVLTAEAQTMTGNNYASLVIDSFWGMANQFSPVGWHWIYQPHFRTVSMPRSI